MKEIRRPEIEPNAIDIEMAVLGSMMSSQQALYKGLELLTPEVFYQPNHRIIFEVIRDIAEGHAGVKRVPDILTVKDELEKRGKLEEAGGAAYLASLLDEVINPEYIEEHAKIIIEKFLYRKTIEICNKISKECYEEEKEAEKILDEADAMLFSIRSYKLKGGFIPLRDLLKPFFEELTHLMEGRGVELPAGFHELDTLTTGFHKGDFIVIASRPAMGKTSFALNITRNLAVEFKKPVGFFSIEMPKEQIVQRLLCMEANIEMQKLRKGEITAEEFLRLSEAAERLKNAPIYIDDTPKISIQELRAKARRACKEHELEVIFIDFLQVIDAPKMETRQQQIAYISASLKSLAMELKIPVIALAQLSREVERRADKRPQLADLRESGAIEQDADMVIFLFREDFYNPESAEEGVAEIIVGKNRNGPIGTVKLGFLKKYMKFTDYPLEREIGEFL
jgi:replicative DNA helicase